MRKRGSLGGPGAHRFRPSNTALDVWCMMGFTFRKAQGICQCAETESFALHGSKVRARCLCAIFRIKVDGGQKVRPFKGRRLGTSHLHHGRRTDRRHLTMIGRYRTIWVRTRGRLGGKGPSGTSNTCEKGKMYLRTCERNQGAAPSRQPFALP
ncbi:hypothetical protein L226DRAFT_43105 [Lentinus tigrinus ALCF2SS1-7]|uniref:uncharacterized protein n=1 Tax=Lentinus tigrinus ALCF2SS1-7 TaxID=1328758 RepID=UPI0011660CB7|nr:hypothetical protein L226DRAFT_43105 [Lentinus tigrinus ALCF2SS1-7]